ncbi:MAG TPA: HD domain-containing phosphohydrolase [Candidatus Solibacter sp.]|nr:HD domain-containing phosphohydrolase [Candidatus Solibacter sp.]
MMNGKILFVDDEPDVLAGYSRTLRREFHLSTAPSGDQALAELRQNGPYEVVVSDLRMSGIDGLQLLSQVKDLAPQTVRVLLTGNADLQTAIKALNEDTVFRFLTKPCPTELLKKTLTACLLQHQLVSAEKDLLEKTLMGSIKVLTDVLNLASPAAFGRAMRVKRYVEHMVRDLNLENPWRYEAAAMLSQLGCITLAPEVLDAAYRGDPLPPEEQVHFNMHPAIARDVLENIPRLEGIAWIVGQQLETARPEKRENGNRERENRENREQDGIKTGAMILQAALAFDKLKEQGQSKQRALSDLEINYRFDPSVLQALETLPDSVLDMANRTIPIASLVPGMILDQELRSSTGLLLAGKGQEVTYPLVLRLKNFHRRHAIADAVTVLTTEKTQATRAASN